MTGLHADLSATFTAEGTEAFTVKAAFDVDPGESLVILGPSGSGKTLLLETLAGFHPHEGRVSLDGRRVDDLPPERRDFGFVFQDYALFPHLSVRENVEYGARYHEGTRDADALLAELGVADLADRTPPTLSGGEKQRVALARALAVRPDVMLLDEPLAALDVPTRRTLRDELIDVLADVTAVYVTHDRTTARAIGDRIVVMQDGRIVQEGTPEAVFERPASPSVATFTGANVVDLAAAPSLRERLDGKFAASGADEAADHVAIRPEAVRIGRRDGDRGEADGVDANVGATVERVVHEDATTRVTCSFDGVSVDAFADRPPTVGDEVCLGFPRDRLTPLEGSRSSAGTPRRDPGNPSR